MRHIGWSLRESQGIVCVCLLTPETLIDYSYLLSLNRRCVLCVLASSLFNEANGDIKLLGKKFYIIFSPVFLTGLLLDLQVLLWRRNNSDPLFQYQYEHHTIKKLEDWQWKCIFINLWTYIQVNVQKVKVLPLQKMSRDLVNNV